MINTGKSITVIGGLIIGVRETKLATLYKEHDDEVKKTNKNGYKDIRSKQMRMIIQM